MKKLLLLCLAAVCFSSCKDEPDVIMLYGSEKTLFNNDTYQIEAKSISPITYVSGNEYHTTVSETGLVTARFVGQTNISLTNAEDSKTFNVIVKPLYNVFPEPNAKIGDNRNTIIARFGTPSYETFEGLTYTDYSTAAPLLVFLFDESNRLTSYSLMVKSSYASSLTSFLSERYMALPPNGGLFMFINSLTPSTASLLVGMTVYNESYIRLIYTSVSSYANLGFISSSVPCSL